MGSADVNRERVPQGADAHEVGVSEGRGPRGKPETKVETRRTTTST